MLPVTSVEKIPSMLEFLLSPFENNDAKELSKSLRSLKSVTLALQREDIDMASFRLLFDELLRKVPNLDPRKRYIYVNCDIAKNPEFESGVVKILNSEEGSMSVNEQLSCRKLRKSNAVDVEETPNPGDLDDFASVVLAKRLKHSLST